ncbi:DNA-binding helix-turn-helix protein [Leptospira inadai serovar Lyme str. 10]|uniref:DNA-binding helix-turn-helix protein n=2 Tax=Leptospira inadai serovar Lyme TaxID=293084 RepID=V6H9H0_9LEPT|nr:helix-turn-helix transcriptional regulator [Leptospira inadai]EQA35796.1 DNA-binding helix-turn-helix protein [Leptospira inadai serovar Lyme str. 10]PNV76741.1 XRE family transcriptional regulator [Leptospira inadai serovar Lyme]
MIKSAGERVKFVRTEGRTAEINQKDFAEEIKITQAMLSLIESNKQPLSYAIALKIEKATGYRAEWLIDGVKPEKLSKNFQEIRNPKDQEELLRLISKTNAGDYVLLLLSKLSSADREAVFKLIESLASKRKT